MFKKLWNFMTRKSAASVKKQPPNRARRRRVARMFRQLAKRNRHTWGMPGNKTVAGLPFQRTTTGRRTYEEQA